MKKIVLAILTISVLTSCSASRKFAKKTEVDYASTITQEDLQNHLTIYASDEFGGRDTGEESGVKAVDYLVSQYEKMKLVSPNGDFRQNVPMLKTKSAVASVRIGTEDFKIGEDFINYFSAASGDLKASDVAYVGYGIDDDNYSDYNNIDVDGKVVLMRVGEPMSADSIYTISGTKEPSSWSSLRQSYRARESAAKEHGATSMLIVFDDETFEGMATQYEAMTHGKGQISLDEGKEEKNEFYSFFVSPKLGDAIVKDVLTKEEPEMVKDLGFSISYMNNITPFTANNVVAYIKGEEKPDEYIVISAHLDHVGIDEQGRIYNGADDDGSGTVAILEIAEAFNQAAKEGHRPKRSIIFLHVTGEEKGLLGSRYYTDFDPIVPLENTVTNLNIDMIGRTDPKREGNRNYVYLIGSDKLSTELHEISEEVNKKYTNIDFDYTYNAEDDPNRFYYRSDHYNFAKNNIPVIFYFNGTHDDYHKHTDTIDKIEWDLLQNRTLLVFYTAWELANRENKVIVDKAN